MAENLLATFVHISDLHIGDQTPTGPDAATSSWWRFHKQFDGLLGHEYRSCVQFERFFDRMRKRYSSDLDLIMTGDLTSLGRDAQFHWGEAFLGDYAITGDGRPVGIAHGKWVEFRIPGNHDHWPGTGNIFGSPTSSFKNIFGDVPGWDTIRSAGVPTVRFLRIDTDVDVDPNGLNRFLARGSFTSHLQQLENELEPPNDNEIRVLILHHSRAHAIDRALPKLQRVVLGIDNACLEALDDFIVNNDIAVMLTGHLHDPTVHLHHVHSRGHTLEVMEARCGTTTQRYTLPYTWRTPTGKRVVRKGRSPNTLLIHQLRNRDDGIYWESTTYVLTPQQGFVPYTDLSPERDDLGGIHKVWPRPWA